MQRRALALSICFWVVLVAVLRVVVVPPESCGDASPSSIDRSARAAASWMIRSQKSDGSYRYDYDADSDSSSDDYNEVRHAGVTMALYQAAGRLGDRQALRAADRALAWMQRHLVRKSGWAALSLDARSASLGATALMLVGLAERRLSTGDTQNDPLMHELASFMVTLQSSRGSFSHGFDFEKNGVMPGTSLYYPGEAVWAFTLMHNAFPREGWDTKALLSLDYLAGSRDAEQGNRIFPFNDQWAAYAIAEVAHWKRLQDLHVRYAHRLAARFGLLVRSEAQGYGSSYGRLFRGDYARGASAGTWVEGLAALWRAGRYDPRLADIGNPVTERATCMAGILAERQISAARAQTYKSPPSVEGSWLDDGETRIDDQQHAFSGLLYTGDALRDHVEREPTENLHLLDLP